MGPRRRKQPSSCWIAVLLLSAVLLVNGIGLILVRWGPARTEAPIEAVEEQPLPSPEPQRMLPSLAPSASGTPAPAVSPIAPARRFPGRIFPQGKKGRESMRPSILSSHVADDSVAACGDVVLHGAHPGATGVALLWPSHTSFRSLLLRADLIGVLVTDASTGVTVGKVVKEVAVDRKPVMPTMQDLVVSLDCSKPEARALHARLAAEPYPKWVAEFYFGFSATFSEEAVDNLRRDVHDLVIGLRQAVVPLHHITHIIAPLHDEALQEEVGAAAREAHARAWQAGVRVQIVALVTEEDSQRIAYPLKGALMDEEDREGERKLLLHGIRFAAALDAAWAAGQTSHVLVTSSDILLEPNAYIELWEGRGQNMGAVLEHAHEGRRLADGSSFFPYHWLPQLQPEQLHLCSIALQLEGLGGAVALAHVSSSKAGVEEAQDGMQCDAPGGEAPADWSYALHLGGRRTAHALGRHLDVFRRDLDWQQRLPLVEDRWRKMNSGALWHDNHGEGGKIFVSSIVPSNPNVLVVVATASQDDILVVSDFFRFRSEALKMLVSTSDGKEDDFLDVALFQHPDVSFSERYAAIVGDVAEMWLEEGSRHMFSGMRHYLPVGKDVVEKAFSAAPYVVEVVVAEKSVLATVRSLIACNKAPGEREMQFVDGRLQVSEGSSKSCFYSIEGLRNPTVRGIFPLPKEDRHAQQGWEGGVLGYVFNHMAIADAYRAAHDKGDIKARVKVRHIWLEDLCKDQKVAEKLLADALDRQLDFMELPTMNPDANVEVPSDAEILAQIASFVIRYRDAGMWLPAPHPRDKLMLELFAVPESFL